MSNEIYRKVALDRLSSPEALDQLITVTNPKGWLALIGLGAILLTIVIWGFFGNISTQITGTGLITTSGGLISISHIASGQVTDISVLSGDEIRQGDVLARLEQSELVDSVNQYRSEIKLIENFDVDVYQNNPEEYSKTLEEFYPIASEILKLKASFQTGLSNTNASLEMEALNAQLETLKYIKLNELKGLLDNTVDELLEKSEVVSMYYGKVLESYIKEGDLIQAGTPLFSIARNDGEANTLEAVLFVSPEVGKKIQLGMTVHISPSIAKVEDYGFMIGEVSSVSEYPVSTKYLEQTYNNDQLISTLTNGTSPIEVHVNLIQDASTFSGFKWSTREGADMKIESGNICEGTIILSNSRPVELIIPAVRKTLNLN